MPSTPQHIWETALHHRADSANRVLHELPEALIAHIVLHASRSSTERDRLRACRPLARCTRTVLSRIPKIDATSAVSKPAQSRSTTDLSLPNREPAQAGHDLVSIENPGHLVRASAFRCRRQRLSYS
jgi:hypothetical protein